MTSITWTTSAKSLRIPSFDARLVKALKDMRHFLAVCIGVYAEQDSNYRGLDLNGNPVWAKRPTH